MRVAGSGRNKDEIRTPAMIPGQGFGNVRPGSLAGRPGRIRVLVVDDSAVVRKLLREAILRDSQIGTVETATDPFVARNKILKLNPEVVVLDIEMPRMDGLTFLKKLMHYHPLPVIIMSTSIREGGQKALQALELGAVDVMSKSGGDFSFGEMAKELTEKIKMAARVRIRHEKSGGPKRPPRLANREPKRGRKIIAVGASTGGTKALEDVLSRFPTNSPPVLVVQHMPEQFTRSFAERLNSLCAPEVREAQNGDRVVHGQVLIAPGNKHLLLRRSGMEYLATVTTGPQVQRQRPSVDVLFESVSQAAKKDAVGVVLTGMGSDGATGLKAMHDAGAATVVQDEETSVVFGMPREAIEAGGVDHVLPLSKIAERVLSLAIGLNHK